MVNLTKMTTEGLEKLVSEAVAELKKRVQAEQEALDKRRRHIAHVLSTGSTIEKQVVRKDPRIGTKIEPKFELGSTKWSGRGIMPLDIKKYIKGDKEKLKELLIKNVK